MSIELLPLVGLFLLQCWYVTESTQGVKQKMLSILFRQVFTMVVVGLTCTVSMKEIMLNLALIFFLHPNLIFCIHNLCQ